MPHRRLPALNALRAFEAVARHGSFKAAAAELCVTPAALSQQVRKLEQDLDLELFLRRNRSIETTPAGIRLHTGLTAAFLRMHEAVESIRPSTHRNRLAVSCEPAFASKWLSPRLSGYIDGHPDLEIALVSHVEFTGSSSAGIDAGIRLSREAHPELETTWLQEEVMVPLAAPEFIEKHRLREPGDILRVPLIQDDGLGFCNGPTWESWFAAAGLNSARAHYAIHFGRHQEQSVDAAIAGAGVALCRKTLAARDLAAGRLRAPVGPGLPGGARYQFLWRDSTEPAEPLAAFRTWITGELSGKRIGGTDSPPLSASA